MKTFSALIAAVFTSVAAHGATVGWQAAIDTGLIDSSGAALAQGNFVRIGYFANFSDAQVTSNAATLSGISALNSDFRQFASATIGTGSFAAASFAINSSPTYASLALQPGGFDQVAHPQIYFWVLKATNNSTLATAVSSATESAIAYLPSGSGNPNATAWQFPASDLTIGKTLDISDLAGASRQILDGTYVSTGTPALDGIFGTTNNHALKLAVVAVPEPSVIAMGAVAAMMMAGRRKRRCV